jgi:methyl-accepting chemotaxis protein
MDQIAERIRVVAAQCAQLFTSSEDALGILGGINQAISRINEETSASVRLAVDVTETAHSYREGALSRVSQGIRRIRDSVDVTATHFDQLRRHSEEIGKIIDVINDVTESSRLLALNAAILAAQAGEHGRGFAVVAEEIDALANRAARSVADVARVISTVQQELGEADAHVRGAVVSVDEGGKVFEEAERDLSRIFDSSQRASRSAETIEEAAAEQLRAVEAIQTAMHGIRDRAGEIDRAVAQQNESVGTVARSTEELTRSSAQVSEAAELQSRGILEFSRAFGEVVKRTQEMDVAVGEHQVAVGQIGKALDLLGPLPERGRQLAEDVLKGFASIGKRHDRLRAEISRFRVSDGDAAAKPEE